VPIFLTALLHFLPSLVGASEPLFIDLNTDTSTTVPNFRFDTGDATTEANDAQHTSAGTTANLRASSSAQQQRRKLAVAADWRPWPSSSINNIEIVHNLCDADWIKAVEDAARAWSDASQSVGLTVTQAKCNSRVNGDLTFIPWKIHLVYGTCGSDCCGKATVEYGWMSNGEVTNYQSLVRLDPECFDGDFQDGKLYLACHEIGHAIGLGHNNDRDSCLAPYNGNNSGPGSDDVRVLDNQLYSDARVQGVVRPPPTPSVPPPSPSSIFANPGTLTTIITEDCRAGECGQCQGDCDSDSQCKPGLRCYFRSDLSPVPGCKGSGESAKDYCYDPSSVNTVQARPTPRPPAPTRRPPTSPKFQLKYLSRVSNKNCGTRQCGKCQGDCDQDSDCQSGLKCFKRKSKNPMAPVPGCLGDGKKGRDYCYDPNDPFILQQGRVASF